MTPDQKVALWIATLTALPTIVFTGAVAYWNWRRDQERVIVRTAPLYWKTLDGELTDAALNCVGIAVTNLSLYPVRIAGLAFLMNGKAMLILNRGKHSSDEWPLELASHARRIVYLDESEWNEFEAKGLRRRINDAGFVAVAVTETGRRFTSNRLKTRIARPFWAVRGWLTKMRARNSK